jgi:hypothetical protein
MTTTELGTARPTTEAAPAAPIEWTFNPWRKNFTGALFVIVFMLFTGAILFQLGLSTLTGTLLLIAFMFTLHPAIAIQRCRVDDAGVARRMLFVWERRPWDRIGRAKVDKSGLWVWPSPRPGRIEMVFRALWLPTYSGLSDDERGELHSALRRRLGEHGL